MANTLLKICLFLLPFSGIIYTTRSQVISKGDSIDSLIVNIDKLESLPRYQQLELFDRIRPEVFKALEQTENIYSTRHNKLRKAVAIDYQNKGEYNNAIPVLNLILKTENSVKDSIEVLGYLRKAYLSLNNLSNAYRVQKIIDRIRERNKHISWAYIPRLSSLYYHFSMYHEAIGESKKELKQLEKDTLDSYYLAHYNNDLGLFYSRLGNIDSALFYYNTAQNYLRNVQADPLQQNFFEGLIKGNIAQAIMIKGRYEEAIPLLLEDIKYSTLSRNEDNAAISHNEIAQCYIHLNEPEKAIKHLDTAFNILRKVEMPKVMLTNRKLLASAFKELNDTLRTLRLYSEIVTLQDSIMKTEQSRNLINQQIIHELNLREAENNLKQEIIEKNKIERERIEQKQSTYLAILIMTGILITVLIFFNVKSKEKSRHLAVQYNQINEQKEVIESSLKEKELLLQEIHHRVKNNMQIISSLIRLQQEKINNKDAHETLSQSKRRIESMALVHQQLYQGTSFNEIKMNVYIETLVNRLTHLLADPLEKPEIKLKTDPLTLHIDKAIPLGLIINEIVTNAFKHGIPVDMKAVLSIELKKLNNKIVFTATDNGKGFPEDVILRRERSLGIELIEILCDQLDAELQVKSEKGVRYEIVF